jgi:hypothetical protein
MLLMLLLLIISGCENIEIKKDSKGSYDNLDENVEYGEVDLTIEVLNGEMIYSFETKADVEYEFQYDVDIEEGDFKIEVFSNGETLEETEWTSADQELLESEHGNKNSILHGVGGTITIKNVDEQLSIVLHGRDATGKFKVTW